MKEKIARLKADGASFLFFYASGALTDGGFSADSLSKFVGINTDFSSWVSSHAVTDDESGKQRIYGKNYNYTKPYLKCTDEKAEIWGRDMVSGEAQFAVKRREDGGFDAWSLRWTLPDFVLRRLARLAGVFIYSDEGLPVYANSAMVCLFSHKGGKHLLNLPEKRKVTDAYTGEEHIISGKTALNFKPNECKFLLYEAQ